MGNELTAKELETIKYYEGYMDAMNEVSTIAKIMTEQGLKAHKEKNENHLLACIVTATKMFGVMFKSVNETLEKHVMKLAKDKGIDIDIEKEVLVVNYATNELTKEQIKTK